MRKNLIIIAAAALFAPLSASAATNLVTNGSFENGLAGWTLSGAVTDSYPAVVITYGSTAAYPTSTFGEAVAAENAAAGTHGAYFVSDFSNQSLTQQVYLGVGTYQIGFSAYAPANGYGNAHDATFSGSIAGDVLANYSVSQKPGTTWLDFSGKKTVTAAGMYNIAFSFNTSGYPAKDVVIDSVYVMTAAPVPEPETYALMLSGLGLIGFVARRRRADQA